VIKLVPGFARVLGLEEFRKKLFPLCTAWLADKEASVRETMAMQLGALVQLFGVDWAGQTLAPMILQFRTHWSYLIRQITLFCIIQLKRFLPLNVLVARFLPAVIEMATDKIPNVRFGVANTLSVFLESPDPKVIQQIQTCITTLCNDPDGDVRYFASRVQLKCQ
jgi:serine/threonine-protein phosphatase 2A regulatory subunit A